MEKRGEYFNQKKRLIEIRNKMAETNSNILVKIVTMD